MVWKIQRNWRICRWRSLMHYVITAHTTMRHNKNQTFSPALLAGFQICVPSREKDKRGLGTWNLRTFARLLQSSTACSWTASCHFKPWEFYHFFPLLPFCVVWCLTTGGSTSSYLSFPVAVLPSIWYLCCVLQSSYHSNPKVNKFQALCTQQRGWWRWSTVWPCFKVRLRSEGQLDNKVSNEWLK